MTKIFKGELRIIGGTLRSRKISIEHLHDVRPTPDRVRETLFNWLAPDIHDAVCLDLFAGSGAVGFEAISRGAKKVVFIDQQTSVIKHLNEVKQSWQLLQAEIRQAHIPEQNPFLPNEKFDIIFLDAPFRKDMIESTCAWLEKLNLITPNGLIYIEIEKEMLDLNVPAHWQCLKNKIAGQVRYQLFQRI